MLTRIRSAITGRFVRRSTADRHPESTVAERAGWQKDVSPPDPSSRPAGLPTEKTGRRLRLEAIAAAAAGVVESRLDAAGDLGELFVRNLAAVGLPELRRLEAAVEAIDRPAPSRERAGRVAFDAYVARMGGKTHDGRDVPPWDELGDDVRVAWTTAATAARLAR